jgi:hypothetical protein
MAHDLYGYCRAVLIEEGITAGGNEPHHRISEMRGRPGRQPFAGVRKEEHPHALLVGREARFSDLSAPFEITGSRPAEQKESLRRHPAALRVESALELRMNRAEPHVEGKKEENQTGQNHCQPEPEKQLEKQGPHVKSNLSRPFCP